jgi:hypothetical protein
MLTRSIALTAMLLSLGPVGLAQTVFPNSCGTSPLPFDTIKLMHPIDNACGLKGKPASPAASQLQNSVKDNFCADKSKPEVFTPKMLVDLQNQTHIPSGQGNEPKDRKALQQLGEGKVIRMKIFMIEAHHADLGGGESVNCNRPLEEDNDIHIAFGESPDTAECGSITAEISPHYRPASWNEIGHFETFNSATNKYTVNVALAGRLQAQPYRITGQLFFDASHTVCPCGTHCSPVRSSLWEIHPVYNIEVCKMGTACNEKADGDWVAFDVFWKGLPPLKPPKAPHTHGSHEPVKEQ